MLLKLDNGTFSNFHLMISPLRMPLSLRQLADGLYLLILKVKPTSGSVISVKMTKSRS
jgi:hypothetical protein